MIRHLLAAPAWVAEIPSAWLISEIRGEIPAAAIGFMLLGLGLAAGVAALARRWTADGLRAFLVEHAALPAGEIAEARLARVAAWTGRAEGFDDDLTLVVAGIGAA